MRPLTTTKLIRAAVRPALAQVAVSSFAIVASAQLVPTQPGAAAGGTRPNLPTTADPSPPAAMVVLAAPTTTTELLREQADLEAALAAATLEERIAQLSQFLRTYPASPLQMSARQALVRSQAQLGEQRLRAGDLAGAQAIFRQAVKSLPEAEASRVFRSLILPMPLLLATQGFRREAILLMREFQSCAWNNAGALEQIGLFYVSLEAPADAQEVFKRAVELDPASASFHHGLGVAYQIGLRLEAAAAAFQKATEIDPKSRVAWAALADLQRAAGDYAQAEANYRRQLEIDPEHPTAWGGLAVCYLAQGRESEAIAPMARMLTINPRDVRFLTQLAYLHAANGNFTAAAAASAQAKRLQPNYPWLRIVEAHLMRRAGDFAEAENILGEALQTAQFATLQFELGATLILANAYDQALEPFETFLTVTPDGEFEAVLGGALPVRSPSLMRLLDFERRASLLVAPTLLKEDEIAAVERYVRFALLAKQARAKGVSSGLGLTESPLEAAAKAFVAGKDPARGWRLLRAAETLVEVGELGVAERFARQAIDALGDAARAAGGGVDGLREEDRLAEFYVRAQMTLGWVLYKQGETAAAVVRLREAVKAYPTAPSRREAAWRLGTVLEAVKQDADAFEAYKLGYDANAPTAADRRAKLEAVYRRLHGSLDGFDAALAP
ncbi:MAG: tetratricopeptide repeat protein [Chloracidobacterium sp.]|nr:tetratricopeptide repeat protein [Chloracidobacterium sp.]MDW8216993.1 tetratricopeptide repeat protein [Acidobacteriota bacterium]